MEVSSPASTTGPSAGHRLLRLLLMLLLGVTMLRLLGFIGHFALASLQMDFAAFYTAGAALNAGLSPYLTHLTATPPLWDGINEFRTSRFLYPPLTATLFQPLAQLGYLEAKILWMGAGVGALLLSSALTNRLFHLERTPILLLLFGILVTTYYPLLTYLERGQIDAFTLLLLTGAILGLLSPHRARQVGAGLLIALATLLKLQAVYFVPFLLWRRCWWAVAGYGIGGGILLGLSVGLHGFDSLLSYLQEELPRISQYGDLGPPELLLDRATLATLRAEAPDGYTHKDGRYYLAEAFYFTKNATMVRNLHSIWTKVLGPVQQTTVSLVTFTGLLLGLLGWERWGSSRHQPWTLRQHYFYWQLVLLIILLAGPMTWIMNLIWLLPLGLALLAESRQPLSTTQSYLLALALFALLITAVPDIYTFTLLAPIDAALLRWHYVFAELLLFVALLGYWTTLASATVQAPRFTPAEGGLHG